MNYAIEIKNLIKSYENFTLNIDELKIPSGMIIGLIGENGAGKTTLINSILGIVNPTASTLSLTDKKDIGVVLDNSFFPEILTAKNIDSIMNDIYENWNHDMFYNYLKDFKINDSQKIKTLSKGMKKKLEIATALSHQPKLLILDEPTSGLDPIVRSEVLDIFTDFIKDEEHTILLSTHITSDLEHIADYIIFINEGKIILNKSRDEIFDSFGIVKCDVDKFDAISKDDIVAYKKNKYDYQVIVKDIEACKKKYESFIIDKINLDDLMLIMIKGGN